MKLQNSFRVPIEADRTWEMLLDVPRIVACVPGAELIGQDADGSYQGRISFKLGPVSLRFLGSVMFSAVDPAVRTAEIHAKGADQQGRGNAGAITRMRVVPDKDGSAVLLETDLQLAGSVAQYGRATGVIAGISNEITAEFARALHRQLTEPTATAALAGTARAASPASPHAPSETTGQSASLLRILWRALLDWFGLRRAPV